MTGKKKKTTTIVLEIPIYTQLKDLKIIPEESFSNVIKRLLANTTLKGQRQITSWTEPKTTNKKEIKGEQHEKDPVN